MMEDQEIVREFLIESSENLSRLDQEMVELETRPRDASLLASIFRTIHTIKGTCGFLGFGTLEAITHYAENLLSMLRNGELELTPHRVSLILETVDATRRELLSIEQSGNESGANYEDLRLRLQAASNADAAPPAAPPAALPAASEEPSQPAAAAPPVETARTPVAVDAAPPPEPPAGESAPEPAQAADSPAQRGPAAADSNIRVDVGQLDRLMNLVGELVLARNQILQVSARGEDPVLTATSQRLNLITSQLQEGVMKTRMQPIGVVWNKLPRVVRDLSASCGKQIRLEMDGADTELDKSIIEAIKDPLTHIVRNCCDHGIERPEVRVGRGKSAQGTLQLRAFHEGGQVNIEIIDDGGGIDPGKVKAKALSRGLIRPEQAEAMGDREAVNLVFLPGFSTAEQVTNISGRGVGMDVVKTNIEKIGGTVDLLSRAGEGTTVRLRIPLTLAIIPGLVVGSGGERFVIPQVSLLELLRLEGEAIQQIERLHGAPVYRRRGTLLPLAYLNQVLQLRPAAVKAGTDPTLNIVVLQAEDRQFGLVVDAVHDTQEIVVKPLGKALKGVACYAGATIMGDGKVALILDVMGLGARSGVFGDQHTAGRLGDQSGAGDGLSAAPPQSLLLFRAGSHGRLAVPLSLVARLEEFAPDRIEAGGSRSVVQYRGHILPLVVLGPLLDPGAASPLETGEIVPVVVFGQGEQAVGVVVDQIVDIVESDVTVRRGSGDGLLFGSAVVGDKVTDFVDLPQVVTLGGLDPLQTQSGRRRPRRVLLATGSELSRGMMRAYLEMAGHRVHEARHAAEAIRLATAEPFDVAFVAPDLPGAAGEAPAPAELIRFLRSPSQQGRTRLVGWATVQGQMAGDGLENCDSWQTGLDRESMLASLDSLADSIEAQSGDQRMALSGR
ncbi:MAG: chemotaxis protein CheW [Bryobacterales bacterium]|nr:chemotaxis protein CheW [Bryobacterales bacterium]